MAEITIKNRLWRQWQTTRDPFSKKQMNHKVSFIKSILQTHRQDEWDRFLYILHPTDNSIFKLIRNLLHNKPATHLLIGSNGLNFSASDKSEILTDTYEWQFQLNSSHNLQEVITISNTTKNSKPKNTFFTSSADITSLISYLLTRKAFGEDSITNFALRNLL